MLENGKYGLAFGSGVAATMAALQVLTPGDHIVAGNDNMDFNKFSFSLSGGRVIYISKIC